MPFRAQDLLNEKWLRLLNRRPYNQCFNFEMTLMKSQNESLQAKLRNTPHYKDQQKSKCNEWQSNLKEPMDLHEENLIVQKELKKRLIGLSPTFDNASFNPCLLSQRQKLSYPIGKYFQTYFVRINPCTERKKLNTWSTW